MTKLIIYCTSINYYKILDKLPEYVQPLGLGRNIFPSNWLNDSNEINISHLNKYYGEMTGIYWIWKNKLRNFSDKDWIGNCHYRKWWLNGLYKKKDKFTINSLYSKLLSPNNHIFNESESIQVQPTILNRETLSEQFENVHGKNNIINECVKLLDSKNRNKFEEYLNQNKISQLNMFITRKFFFNKYCQEIFPWLEKCLKFFLKNKLCKGYNIRLPAFLAERFTSYWFYTNTAANYLSYCRIGKFMLSNKINSFFNPTKIPFTFRMYPTIHDY
jgi:hypothetical protein